MNDFLYDFDDDGNGGENDGSVNNCFQDDNFGEDGFFENEFMDDIDDLNDLCDDEKPDQTDSDEFTAKDAFILAVGMAWAYEEGFLDGIYQRRQKKSKKSEKLSRKKRDKDGIGKDNKKFDGDYF